MKLMNSPKPDDKGGSPSSKAWIEPKRNNEIAVYNRNCEVCYQPVSNSTSEVLKCMYCNVVGHLSCLNDYAGNKSCQKPWECFYCVESLEYDKQMFEQEKSKGHLELLRKQAQITISKIWRRYTARAFYLRIYSVIVKLQVLFHIRQRKKAFLQSVQSKLRPMKIKLNKCSGIYIVDRDGHQNSHGKQQKRKEQQFYILITIFDMAKNGNPQTWRIQSNTIKKYFTSSGYVDLDIDEKIIIGGVSGFHHLVLSIFGKGSGRDVFFGQVHLDLSYNYTWKRGGSFTMPLDSVQFFIKDGIGVDMKVDYRNDPQGTIDFELVTYHGMSSECCVTYGTSVEEFVRSISKLPDYSGFSMHVKSSQGQTGGGKLSGISSSSSLSSSSLPLKKLWVAIADGKLYIYNHYGDQLKLCMDLSYFQIQYESMGYRDLNLLYRINRTGYPEFQFFVVNDYDIFRFKCAFLTSVRCAKNFQGIGSDGNLRPMTGIPNSTNASTMVTLMDNATSTAVAAAGGVGGANDTFAVANVAQTFEKFDMNLLIADIVALEVTKLKKNNTMTNGGQKSISKSVSSMPPTGSISANMNSHTHNSHSAHGHTNTHGHGGHHTKGAGTRKSQMKSFGGWSSSYNNVPDSHQLVQSLFDEVDEEMSTCYGYDSNEEDDDHDGDGGHHDDNASVTSLDSIQSTQSMRKAMFSSQSSPSSHHHHQHHHPAGNMVSMSSTALFMTTNHSKEQSPSTTTTNSPTPQKQLRPLTREPTRMGKTRTVASSSSNNSVASNNKTHHKQHQFSEHSKSTAVAAQYQKPSPLLRRMSTLRFKQVETTAVTNQLYEEFLKDEVVMDTKYQTYGEMFMQNMLTKVVQHKHHSPASPQPQQPPQQSQRSKPSLAPLNTSSTSGKMTVNVDNKKPFMSVVSPSHHGHGGHGGHGTGYKTPKKGFAKSYTKFNLPPMTAPSPFGANTI